MKDFTHFVVSYYPSERNFILFSKEEVRKCLDFIREKLGGEMDTASKERAGKMLEGDFSWFDNGGAAVRFTFFFSARRYDNGENSYAVAVYLAEMG